MLIQDRPRNKKEPNKNKRLTFWTSLRNCSYESELVLATQIRKGNAKKSNMQADLKYKNHQVRCGLDGG